MTVLEERKVTYTSFNHVKDTMQSSSNSSEELSFDDTGEAVPAGIDDTTVADGCCREEEETGISKVPEDSITVLPDLSAELVVDDAG